MEENLNGQDTAVQEQKFKVTVITCPHCQGEIRIEKPVKSSSGGRGGGQLAGIAIEDMSDEQLKREIINSKSVLYKAEKRGASADLIAANQARVDACMAEKAKRQPPVATVRVEAGAPGPSVAAPTENIYKDEEANNTAEL